MIFYVFDIEADGLLDSVENIHCLSVQKFEGSSKVGDVFSMTKGSDILNFFNSEKGNKNTYFVGHSIVKYDVPVLNRILGLEGLENSLVDTLGLSFYLYPEAKKHGLEYWGNKFGIAKPKIDDWVEGDIEVYVNRCEHDVRINSELFLHQFNYLATIYDGDMETIMKLVKYLNFKLDCLLEQEISGIPMNLYLAKKYYQELEMLLEEKTIVLRKNMPEEVGVIIKTKPKSLYKKDGELSVYGKEWFKDLEKYNLPKDSEVIRERPNPGSTPQIKEWLFQLGWEPQTFKDNDKGEKIPQISLPFGQGLCKSVKELYEKEPKLIELEQYFVIRHRKNIFKNFIKFYNPKKNRIYSTAHAFTNTLRLRHSNPIVNLPKPGTFYGQQIRECLCKPNNDYFMCGSDVSGLESATAQHYIAFFDPEYVKDMRSEDYDAHTDIAVLSGLMTKEEEKEYKRLSSLAEKEEPLLKGEKEALSRLKSIRSIAKTVNFSATYGAGGPKIAEAARVSLAEGERLHKAYWDRNKGIKQTAESVKTKVVHYKYPKKVVTKLFNEVTEEEEVYVEYKMVSRKQTWLYNPVSGFYLYLKAKKDKFSTLNQSTGVFVFDSWLMFVRKEFTKKNIPILLQYHDELLFVAKHEHKEACAEILYKSMKKVNDLLKLNVEVDISVDFGNNYAECH